MQIPANLGKAGRRLWKELSEGVEYDADELVLLENAAKLADTVAELESLMASEPALITGSAGQKAVNPLVAELRRQRSALSQAVRGVGYPRDGSTALTNSERGSRAARVRWHGRKGA